VSAGLRGIPAGAHVLTVSPVSGTYTLDGVDVVVGAASAADRG
jgi:hypothetical protein